MSAILFRRQCVKSFIVQHASHCSPVTIVQLALWCLWCKSGFAQHWKQTKGCQFDNFVIIGVTVSCHHDNLQCHQYDKVVKLTTFCFQCLCQIPLYPIKSTHGSVVLCFVWGSINSLRAKFFRGNMSIYLHFMSFLHTNKTQVVEIPPRVRQGPAYST